MLFSECFIMAFKALLANKMRSLLTMLGIIIGVGAVIVMVALGTGVKESITNSIASLGSNMLIVSPAATNNGGIRGAAGSNTKLKYDDAKAIKERIKNIDYVSPSIASNYQIVNGRSNWNASVQGVTPDYMSIRSLEVVSGSYISISDMEKRNRVAVLGATVATELFGDDNPVGHNIRINNAPYMIVGVLSKKGQSAIGQDQDDVVYIPLTTAQERLLGITHVQTINIQVSKPEKMTQVQSEVTNLLKNRHRIREGNDNDFKVDNLTSIMELVDQQTAMITALLGSIAAISLVVGGIGIMNIMMVSVTERTREIGIRKALGATFKAIMTQFLIESVVISVVGGFIGVIAAFGICFIINSLGLEMSGSPFKTSITVLPIVVSFIFSVGIGLFFGIYPARKAAKLDPIEALRYE